MGIREFVSFFLLLLLMSLYAEEITLDENCKVEYRHLFLIAMNERHPKRPIGYPYLISFNDKRDARTLRKYLGELFLDGRTMDCRDERTCEAVLEALVEKGYLNVDLGAFQINYRWHRYPFGDYFDIKKSINRSCEILQSKIASKKPSFEEIAKYHSNTKKYNQIYSRALARNEKILEAYLRDAGGAK